MPTIIFIRSFLLLYLFLSYCKNNRQLVRWKRCEHMNISFKYPTSFFPPVTTFLLTIQLILFLLTNLIFSKTVSCHICIMNGEWWRLLTSIFTHKDWHHFLSNCFCLYLLGIQLEKQIGRLRFTTIFFFTGFFGNIASYCLLPIHYVHSGASGAIFGLFGTQLYTFYMQYELTHKKAVLFFFFILFVLLSFTFINPSANPISHLFGLLTGGLLGVTLTKKQ